MHDAHGGNFYFTTPKEKLIFLFFFFLLQLKGRDKMHGWSYSVLEYLKILKFLTGFNKNFVWIWIANGFEVNVIIS